MSILLPFLLFVIFVAIAATLYPEGIWGNAIMLINVVTAGLLATNFWEPLARWAEGALPALSFFWDFLILWGLFALSLGLMRAITDRISRTKVRFLKIADQIGGALLAALVGWVVVCFTTFTLHTAPLGREFLFGGFQPEARMMLGLAPDRQWLGFVNKVSRGSFSRTLSPAQRDQNAYGVASNPAEQKLAVFDRQAQFIVKYAARRSMIEKYVEQKKSLRVSGNDLGGMVPKR